MDSRTRAGTFSSSNIWKLMTNDRSGKGIGHQGRRYIKQVRYEQKLGRAINPERESRPTLWGKFNERRVFDIIPITYRNVSRVRLFHPNLPWSGMPDFLYEETVSDCKCPFSLEVFCDKIESLQDINVYKENFPEDYYQHISNAILLEENGVKIKYFEAIIYVPFESEVEEIINSVRDTDDAKWISFASKDDLPYLIDGGYYKNLNIIRFEVPEEDKQLLKERVVTASLFNRIQNIEIKKHS